MDLENYRRLRGDVTTSRMDQALNEVLQYEDRYEKHAANRGSDVRPFISARFHGIEMALVDLADYVEEQLHPKAQIDDEFEEHKPPPPRVCRRSVLRDSSCVLQKGHVGLHRDRDGFEVDDDGLEPMWRVEHRNIPVSSGTQYCSKYHHHFSPASSVCVCGRTMTMLQPGTYRE